MNDGYGCTTYGQTQSYNSCEPLNGQSETVIGTEGSLQTTGYAAYYSVGTGILLVAIAIIMYASNHKKRKISEGK